MNTATATLPNQTIKLIIFDCDGVLVDSEHLSERQLLAMLKVLGADVTPSYFAEHFLGHSFPQVKAKVASDFGVILPDTFQADYLQALMRLFSAELQATPGLRRFLATLKIPSCVATSSTPERAAHALSTTGLYDFFAGRIFTAAEVSRGKPAPDLFLHAAKTLGVLPEQCLVIEDSVAGICAAHSAGMPVVHYRGGSHLRQLTPTPISGVAPLPHIVDWPQLTTMLPQLLS